MNRVLVITLASLLLGAAAEPEQQPSSPWRHNTRSRTEAGIRSQEQGDAETAQAAFRQALALSPAEPLVQFNAGTAALMGSAEDAVELLEPATRSAQGALRSTALYNLGNAHLEAADFTSAIEAYKESLRLTPDREDAKHNLEIALRRLQQQRQPERQNEQRDEQQEEQGQDEQQRSNDHEDTGGKDQQPSEEQQSPSTPGERQLPNFEDQPDMTAEQAAAILEAVENLEREQRRQQALEQLKRVKGDRDW